MSQSQISAMVLAMALGNILAAAPSAQAQVVGTPDPKGSSALYNSSTFVTGMIGNPMTFDATSPIGGWSVRSQAETGYGAGSGGFSFGFSEKLTVSGSSNNGNGASFILTTGGSLGGLYPDPIGPPEKTDFYYFVKSYGLSVDGMLAPGDRASVDFHLVPIRDAYGNPVEDVTTGKQVSYFYNKIFTNTGTTAIPIHDAVAAEGGYGHYLGDWLYVRDFLNYPGYVSGSVMVDIDRSAQSTGTSWVSFDPTIAVTGTSSLTAVPEPSSVVLSVFGVFGAMAYVACRRFRYGSGPRPGLTGPGGAA